jgi:hypothetical protein
MTRRIASIAVVGIAAMALAGCAAPSVTPAAPTPGPSAAEPSLTPPPGAPSRGPVPSTLPAASALPPIPAAPLVCQGLTDPFPADLLRLPPGADTAGDPASVALRRYVRVEAPPESRMPATGWREIFRVPAGVTFVAPADDGWRVVVMAPGGDDRWDFSEGGSCNLQIQLPDGMGFASWRLDPAFPVDRTSTSVHVLATETACANGKPPVGRVKPATVLENDAAVTIVLTVANVPGGADCPGNPEFPQEVTLGRPLGDRELFDGSSFPPAARP